MKKVFIITGANRGLGKALVDLALNDNDTFIISLSRTQNQEHLNLNKNKFLFLKTDLTNPFSDIFITEINLRINSETVLYFFNNASIISPIDKISNFEQKSIENSLKVNIEYPIKIINTLIKSYSNNKIILINITSGASERPIAYWSLYCASKAFIKMFFSVLKEENANGNITIYNIDPGVIDTDMQEEIRLTTFPSQEYFKSLKIDNKLISPIESAIKILKQINFMT